MTYVCGSGTRLHVRLTVDLQLVASALCSPSSSSGIRPHV
jgi:hypothetical protein